MRKSYENARKQAKNKEYAVDESAEDVDFGSAIARFRAVKERSKNTMQAQQDEIQQLQQQRAQIKAQQATRDTSSPCYMLIDELEEREDLSAQSSMQTDRQSNKMSSQSNQEVQEQAPTSSTPEFQESAEKYLKKTVSKDTNLGASPIVALMREMHLTEEDGNSKASLPVHLADYDDSFQQQFAPRASQSDDKHEDHDSSQLDLKSGRIQQKEKLQKKIEFPKSSEPSKEFGDMTQIKEELRELKDLITESYLSKQLNKKQKTQKSPERETRIKAHQDSRLEALLPSSDTDHKIVNDKYDVLSPQREFTFQSPGLQHNSRKQHFTEGLMRLSDLEGKGSKFSTAQGSMPSGYLRSILSPTQSVSKGTDPFLLEARQCDVMNAFKTQIDQQSRQIKAQNVTIRSLNSQLKNLAKGQEHHRNQTQEQDSLTMKIFQEKNALKEENKFLRSQLQAQCSLQESQRLVQNFNGDMVNSFSRSHRSQRSECSSRSQQSEREDPVIEVPQRLKKSEFTAKELIALELGSHENSSHFTFNQTSSIPVDSQPSQPSPYFTGEKDSQNQQEQMWLTENPIARRQKQDQTDQNWPVAQWSHSQKNKHADKNILHQMQLRQPEQAVPKNSLSSQEIHPIIEETISESSLFERTLNQSEMLMLQSIRMRTKSHKSSMKDGLAEGTYKSYKYN